jgi:hypothetical protein
MPPWRLHFPRLVIPAGCAGVPKEAAEGDYLLGNEQLDPHIVSNANIQRCLREASIKSFHVRFLLFINRCLRSRANTFSP